MTSVAHQPILDEDELTLPADTLALLAGFLNDQSLAAQFFDDNDDQDDTHSLQDDVDREEQQQGHEALTTLQNGSTSQLVRSDQNGRQPGRSQTQIMSYADYLKHFRPLYNLSQFWYSEVSLKLTTLQNSALDIHSC